MKMIVNNCIVNGQPCPLCAEFGNFNGTQERHYTNGLLQEQYPAAAIMADKKAAAAFPGPDQDAYRELAAHYRRLSK